MRPDTVSRAHELLTDGDRGHVFACPFARFAGPSRGCPPGTVKEASVDVGILNRVPHGPDRCVSGAKPPRNDFQPFSSTNLAGITT
jgi:hypothetical protein